MGAAMRSVQVWEGDAVEPVTRVKLECLTCELNDDGNLILLYPEAHSYCALDNLAANQLVEFEWAKRKWIGRYDHMYRTYGSNGMFRRRITVHLHGAKMVKDE